MATMQTASVFSAYLVILLSAFGQPVRAWELSGRITEEDGAAIAGAKIQLGRDSAFSNPDGSYRLVVSSSAVRGVPVAGHAAPYLREGSLWVSIGQAAGNIRVEVFSLSGRRLSVHTHPVHRAGWHRLSADAFLREILGLGWLRVTAGNRADWIRVFDLGSPGARAPERAPALRAAAKAARLGNSVDTLLVSSPGYYAFRDYQPVVKDEVRSYSLFRNHAYGMDSGEARAWREHMARPYRRVEITRTRIYIPEEISEARIVTDDGQIVSQWETDPCKPGKPPRSLAVTYAMGGTTYRDSLDLQRIWPFLASFRIRADSLDPFWERYSLSWKWPTGISATPDRDGMTVHFHKHFYEDYHHSVPDYNQRGVTRNAEGGFNRHGDFQPKADSFTVKNVNGAMVGIQSIFTMVRHPDHDFRLWVSFQSSSPVPAAELAFRNPWPVGGIKAGQVLRLTRNALPSIQGVNLELQSSGPGWMPLDEDWIDTVKQWTVPAPLRKAFPMKFRMIENGKVTCRALAESPVFQILPDAADTTAASFEPNETQGEAALVPMGVWVAAGWDYRVVGVEDHDFFKVNAVAGDKVAVTIRNPNPMEIKIYQLFNTEQGSHATVPRNESIHTFNVAKTGDNLFLIFSQENRGGHYQFRVDKVR